MRTQAQKNSNNNDEKPAIYELIEDTWREEKFENNMLFPSAILYREYLKEKREREEILKVQQEAAQKRREIKERAKKFKTALKGKGSLSSVFDPKQVQNTLKGAMHL